MTNILVSTHRWEAAPPELIALRKKVFIDEQKVPVELEYDDIDEFAAHFTAQNQAGETVGCARLYPSRKNEIQGIIGRVAVLPEHRKKGIAREILIEVIKYGLSHFNFQSFKLSAQLYALPFYEQLGFIPHGEVFIDAGIEHRDMTLYSPHLLIEKLNVPDVKAPGFPFKYGKDDTTWHFVTIEQTQQLLRAALTQATNRVEIYTHDLEYALLNDKDIASLLSKVARTNPNTEIRILVKDEKALTKGHHELTTLVQRLPSKITLKICSNDYPAPTSAFILFDRYAIIYRKNHEKYEGFANFRASGRVRVMRDHFNSLWNRATRSREISVLGL